MVRGLSAYGPTALVPAAWTFTLAAVTGTITERTVLIGLGVMSALLAVFFLTTLSAMRGPVLETWQRVLFGGLLVNLVGLGALLGVLDAGLAALPVYAWMVFPGVAYVLTWRAVDATPLRSVYLAGAVASGLGALGVAAGGRGVIGLGAFVVVGIGQTAGIVAAAYQNATR